MYFTVTTERAGHVGYCLLTCGQGGDTDLTCGMHLSTLSQLLSLLPLTTTTGI